jgi:hypothetical protein
MDIFEDLKVVLLRAAQEELRPEGEQLNVSKLSAMTGVHRGDVRRICKYDEAVTEPQNPISKLIGHWQNASRFRRRDGKPRVLEISDSKNEFAELVEIVCSDLHHATALSELQRLGVVEQVPTGVKLVKGIYVDRRNAREAYEFLSTDMRDMMLAVEQNVASPGEPVHLHLSTIFDKIDAEALPKIREWLLNEGSAFHQRARKYLSDFDFDSNPALKKKRKQKQPARVMLGTFSLSNEKGRNERK